MHVLSNGTATVEILSPILLSTIYMNKGEEFQRETVRTIEKPRKYLKEHSILNLKDLWLDHSLWIWTMLEVG